MPIPFRELSEIVSFIGAAFAAVAKVVDSVRRLRHPKRRKPKRSRRPRKSQSERSTEGGPKVTGASRPTAHRRISERDPDGVSRVPGWIGKGPLGEMRAWR